MVEKKKCFKCSKNIHLYGITCKCKNTYCYLCLDTIKHNCTFNYKEEHANQLKKNNIKLKPNKFEKL
jgi:hypothetical protein